MTTEICQIFFRSLDVRRAFADAMRSRMYDAGYEPHQVTEYLRMWFQSDKLNGFISGTEHVERAADVCNEVRGCMIKRPKR